MHYFLQFLCASVCFLLCWEYKYQLPLWRWCAQERLKPADAKWMFQLKMPIWNLCLQAFKTECHAPYIDLKTPRFLPQLAQEFSAGLSRRLWAIGKWLSTKKVASSHGWKQPGSSARQFWAGPRFKVVFLLTIKFSVVITSLSSFLGPSFRSPWYLYSFHQLIYLDILTSQNAPEHMPQPTGAWVHAAESKLS